MRKTLVLFFLHRSSVLLHTALCAYFLLELTHAFSSHADNMLGKGMLAELRALARTHGLATGSQTVPDGNRPASKLSAKKIDEDRALMKSL